MKQKKVPTKYSYNQSMLITENSNTQQQQIQQLREQLRQSIQQLQQHRLSGELQNQKRVLIEHQYQQLKYQNQQMRGQMENIKKQLSKISKRYAKIKQLRNCQKCKVDYQQKVSIDRQRDAFMKERNVLKNQIKQLKNHLEMIQVQNKSEEPRLYNTIDQMKKQFEYKIKTIQEQRKVIRFLDDKLSAIQRQKLDTLNILDSLDQRFQEVQMENNILKGYPKRDKDSSSPCRKTGSIKNIEKLQRSRLSRDF